MFYFSTLQLVVKFVKPFYVYLVVNAVTSYFAFLSWILFLFSLHVNVSIVIRSAVTKQML